MRQHRLEIDLVTCGDDVAGVVARALIHSGSVDLTPGAWISLGDGDYSPGFMVYASRLAGSAFRGVVCDQLNGLFHRCCYTPEMTKSMGEISYDDLVRVSDRHPVDVIAGVARGGTIFATLLGYMLGVPSVSVEKGGLINDGAPRVVQGKYVLLVEDVLRSGGSTLGAARMLRKAGARVVRVFAIAYYKQAVAESAARRIGAPIYGLVSMGDVVANIPAASITEKHRRQVLRFIDNPHAPEFQYAQQRAKENAAP